MKKYSIIVPCNNSNDYLDVCVNSLLKQTIGFDSLEIIFIDDNSNDNGHTVNKLKEYENKYPDNIVLILNDENMGPGGCRNIALEYVSGEYVAYLDSDDWIDDDTLEKLYLIAKKHDADVVEFGFSNTGEHDGCMSHSKERSNECKVYEIKDESARKEFVLPSDSSVVCWDKIYRADMLKNNKISFAEHISYEEPPFSYTVRFFSDRYVVTSDRYYYYYNRPDSMSDIERYKKNRFNIVDGYIRLLNELSDKKLLDKFREEVEFIFWCGAFYLPLFNMAAAKDFYTKEEFISLQKMVKEHVNNICDNMYFKSMFSGLEIIGKVTYCMIDDNVYEEVRKLFSAIAGK